MAVCNEHLMAARPHSAESSIVKSVRKLMEQRNSQELIHALMTTLFNVRSMNVVVSFHW